MAHAASVDFLSVRKSYGEVDIVKGIDLAIAPGEFLVLVGPSGCGKSTTLRMVAGLEEVTSGELRIGGKRANETQPKDRDIGMVFQSYALYPHMTVRENMGFGLALRKTPQKTIDVRVQEVAAMLDLGQLLSRRPAQLSGGQRQRVAMGRAIARDPRVFLFDEPLSNLDTALRVRMRASLQALHQKLGITTIYVTHDQVEAMTLATRVAVLNGGILQQVGPPAELFHAPINRFVATFLGSPSMNLLDGVIDDGARLSHGDLRFTRPQLASSTRVAALGFRPHDAQLRAADDGTPSENQVPGTIAALERMGWEAYAHVDSTLGTLIVRTTGDAADAAHVGDNVRVAFGASAVHAFDGEGRHL